MTSTTDQRPLRTAIFPGSFDPITNGHVDVVTRAAAVFDRVIVGVLANPRKAPLLDVETRIRLIEDALAESGIPAARIEIEAFDGLTVDLCRARGATAIVRGLRAISDFEYEMQMAHMNRHLSPAVETVFLMPDETNSFLSSRLVKEVFSLGGDVAALVPPAVHRRLQQAREATGGGPRVVR